jgi:hypothetical protein
MAAAVPAHTQQFIEAENPLVYYRVESGHWEYDADAMANDNFETIYLQGPPNYNGERQVINYLHSYSKAAVFDTVFVDVFPYPTEKARLFFRTLANGNFKRAYHGGSDITIVKVRTESRLESAEDYVADLQWTHPKNNELYTGPALDSLFLQGATRREYVVDMHRVEKIEIRRYHTHDGRIFTSLEATPFAVTEDCVTEAIPRLLPAPSRPPASETPAVRRAYEQTIRERAREPANFMVVTQIQPATEPPRVVLWNRITVDGTCVTPR